MPIINGVNISAAGSQGITGVTGLQGPIGSQGILGIQGAQGTTGIQGTSGSGIAGIHNIWKLGTASTLWVTSNFNGLAPVNASVLVNRMYFIPFQPAKDTTYSYIFVNVSSAGVAGSLARIVIYSDLNGKPNTKLYESTDLTCTTTGQKIASTTGTFLAGTLYWLGMYGNSTTVFTHLQLSSTYPIKYQLGSALSAVNGYLYDVTFGSAPTTLTTASITNSVSFLPLVGIAMG